MARDDYWIPAYELMLEEARRSIDRQADRLQSSRERSVGLVGFGSLVAAALGLGSGDPGPAGWVALLAFVVVTTGALYVLYPRQFDFEMGAQKMNAWFYDDRFDGGIGHMIHTTAMRHGEHHVDNQVKLEKMSNAIAVGVAALGVETVALVVRLVV